MINARQALIIQVVDDAAKPISSKEIARIASKFIPTTEEYMRYSSAKGYIKRAKGSRGYSVTEKGVQALLEFERTVKGFLDNPTH